MTYQPRTRKRVELYLKRKHLAVQKEILFLGMDRQQVQLSTLKLILRDLRKEKKIVISRPVVGRKSFVVVSWHG